MPSSSRPRPSKVTKPATTGAGSRHGSKNLALSSAAQEQLQQFARQANSSVGSDAPPHLTLDSMLAAAVGGPMAHHQHIGSATEDDLHSLADHHTPDPSPPSSAASSSASSCFQPEEVGAIAAAAAATATRTAAEVAFAAYGDLVKIDSALCKKLAGEVALREPTQRRHDQRLNIERRSNVEALLAHVTGEPAARACKNCHKGHGPWTQCVVYDGQMCGSCTNCWFNASGSRCTFHENNHHQPQAIFAAGSVTTAPSGILTYQPPAAAAAATTASASLPQSAPMSVVIAPPDVTHWGISGPTKQLINQAMGDVASYSRRDRFLARIEAAAKELGMRIAEYEEFLRTPEGLTEQHAALDRESDQSRGQSPCQEQDNHSQAAAAPEASMGDAHSHDGLLS